MSSFADVDPAEVGKFEALAQAWWDPRGELASLHKINPLRADFIMRNLPTRSARILDIGCGGGILAEAMARAGARVTGIDPSPAAIRAARRHAQEGGLAIDYRQTTVEAVAAEAAGAFDAVTAMEILEHHPRPERLVAEGAKTLAPGGRMFFSTIDRTFLAWLTVIFAAENILHLLPRGSHSFHKLIRPRELKAWAERSGLAFRKSAGMLYNPFTRRFRLVTGRTAESYLMCFEKPRTGRTGPDGDGSSTMEGEQ